MRGTGFWTSLLVVVLTPVAVLAAEGGRTGRPPQQPATEARLWEVAEVASIVKRVQTRDAAAALVGFVGKGAPICPAWLADLLGVQACSLTAFASDSISLTTGTGPVSGLFWIVLEGPDEVDGPEFFILEGALEGQIGLNPPAHIGFISGQWRAQGVRDGLLDGFRMEGLFEGPVYLPFVAGATDQCETGYRYTIGCVLPGELSVGFTPLVRMDIEFR